MKLNLNEKNCNIQQQQRIIHVHLLDILDDKHVFINNNNIKLIQHHRHMYLDEIQRNSIERSFLLNLNILHMIVELLVRKIIENLH